MLNSKRRGSGADDLRNIRLAVLKALFSEDVLRDDLVLKGGNALELVYQIAPRGSLDLDFSIERDFEDAAMIGTVIERALRRDFETLGIRVIDFKFEARPSTRRDLPDWWGGHRVEFKLLDAAVAESTSDIEAQRRRSMPVGANQERKFKIDISAHEHCGAKASVTIGHYSVFVYTLEMIVAEKLRAICQQMPSYPNIRGSAKRARARDFYDIVEIDRTKRLNIDEGFVALLRKVFQAKRVNIDALSDIANVESFHEPDWSGVETSLGRSPGPFRDYFSNVLLLVDRILKMI